MTRQQGDHPAADGEATATPREGVRDEAARQGGVGATGCRWRKGRQVAGRSAAALGAVAGKWTPVATVRAMRTAGHGGPTEQSIFFRNCLNTFFIKKGREVL